MKPLRALMHRLTDGHGPPRIQLLLLLVLAVSYAENTLIGDLVPAAGYNWPSPPASPPSW